MPIPDKTSFTNPSITEIQFKNALNQLIDFLKEFEKLGLVFAKTETLLSFTPEKSILAKALDTGKVWSWSGSWQVTNLSEFERAVGYINGEIAKLAEDFNNALTDYLIPTLEEDATTKANTAKSEAINHIDSIVGIGGMTANIIPLAIDNFGNIPIWLEDGSFDFANSKALGKSDISSIIPLAVDAVGNIPVWLEDGALGFSAIGLDTLNYLSNFFQSRKYQTNVLMGQRPINTDSRSLHQWKAKASRIKSGATDQLRVVLAGDSWAEHSTIATELKTILQTEYGEAGSGWINLGTERNMLDGITITYGSGWTINDLDSTSAAFPYGCGPDGFTRTSTTVGSTITLANLTKGDQLTVFFGNTGGVFSYTINGVETNVTANTAKKVLISLNGTTSVVLKIISGTICFFGMHLRKTEGSGVEFNKVGNGNSTGQDYLKISPAGQAEVSSFLNPDVLIIILGTNDYRRGHSVSNFKAGIVAMIDGFKSASPNCAVILIAPAQSSVASPPIPLNDFVEAIFELIYYRQTEVYNMFDDWGSYHLENSNGQWADTLHVSKSGAYRLSRQIFKRFLEI
ncbi:SGNH/GDSL hydrolase family protein [Acinetobacter venetianus]|nr:SGNH/GDSL hydrolase family protein [Acinetobacter venetianus]